MGQPTAPMPQALPTRGEQLLILIAGLQQQMATLLQQNGEARVKVAKPPLFSRRMEEVSTSINTACLYLSIRMTGKPEATRMA